MSTKRKSLIAALCLGMAALVPATPALAELESSPMMNEGKQVGCQLTFGQSQPDPANFKKGDALVEGSISLLKFDKNMVFALKIGVTGEGQTKRTPPVESYFVSGTTPNTSSLISKLDSDTLGYRLFAFKVDDPTIAAIISSPGKERIVRLSYRLREGGPETPVVISLAAEPDRLAFVGWLDCIGKITE